MTDFSVDNTDADAIYSDADIVVRQPKLADAYAYRLNLACNSGI